LITDSGIRKIPYPKKANPKKAPAPNSPLGVIGSLGAVGSLSAIGSNPKVMGDRLAKCKVQHVAVPVHETV
jgi:hypothetical protein